MERGRRRFWIEVWLAIACTAAFVLTLAWPEWIEEVLHIEPDGGSGAVEWLIVAVLAVAALASWAAARSEWRRGRAVAD